LYLAQQSWNLAVCISTQMFVLLRCVETQLLWNGPVTLQHFTYVYMCWGAVRGSTIGTALHTVSAIHLPDFQLNIILCNSLSAFKENVSNVEWVPCDHRTVRLFRRSRKVIVGSNPTNSEHASKPNMFKFPPLKGVWPVELLGNKLLCCCCCCCFNTKITTCKDVNHCYVLPLVSISTMMAPSIVKSTRLY